MYLHLAVTHADTHKHTQTHADTHTHTQHEKTTKEFKSPVCKAEHFYSSSVLRIVL